MLTYVESSIFSSPADVLVNTVNTVGVMGKGIALEFRKLYKEMFREYQLACEVGQFDIGDLMLFRTSNKLILNFPTKKHWRSPSRLEYIEVGLRQFVYSYSDWGITSVSFPQLGCGNGELNWESQVRGMMERYLSPLPLDVFVHLYPRDGMPEHRISDETRDWLRSEPRSLPITEVWEDLFETSFPDASSDTQLDPTNGNMMLASILRWIWENLRSFGYIGYADITERFGDDGDQLAHRLTSLPYVEETHFAPAPDGQAADTLVATFDLVAHPKAAGLRIVPERLPKVESELLVASSQQLGLWR